MKNAIGILIWIALNLEMCSMVFLRILILPIHEHGMSFHFFVLSSVSFASALFIYLFIYLFMAISGLCCSMQDYSLQRVGFSLVVAWVSL